ncbi:MAG: DEAD/DEAH box helicase [Cyclobacteriaceae bacterium]|nr:DEAD/DEAH box helicase [Flammeovirgaceae bacterium]MCZ8328173.1 DEAD/DEAH box helicase [Cyclobacteriaceae bacterium]
MFGSYNLIFTEMTFDSFHLHPALQKSIALKKYTAATPIQEQSIPAILTGSDLLATAQTGTGKTASFLIPIFQKLVNQKINRPQLRVLVLVPTRELAVQVEEEGRQLAQFLPLKFALVFGGVSTFHQIKQIKSGVDVIIATPGRLLDLIQQKVIHLSTLTTLVLDEADRMLDMGFSKDIHKILKYIPGDSQKLLFSATLPPEIQDIAKNLLYKPVHITIEKKPEQRTIEQAVYYVNKDSKKALLRHVIKEQSMKNVLVFARTKHGADKIVKDLVKNGISAEAIHSNKSQNARLKALHNFKENATRVLVATDIASRGIDIQHLPYVINYEMPQSTETYTHRIGRTGRAGNLGIALSFCDPEEKKQMKNISKIYAGTLQVKTHPFNS